MLDTRKMLSDINSEIGRLTKIRDLLTVDDNTTNGLVPLVLAPHKKDRLSPEGRKRIAEAAKRRGKAQAQAVAATATPTPTPTTVETPPARKKPHFTPEGKARLSAAIKKRWREAKKLGMTPTGVKLKPKKAKKASKKSPAVQPAPVPA